MPVVPVVTTAEDVPGLAECPDFKGVPGLTKCPDGPPPRGADPRHDTAGRLKYGVPLPDPTFPPPRDRDEHRPLRIVSRRRDRPARAR